VVSAGQIIRRDFGEVLYVSPEPPRGARAARARAGAEPHKLTRRRILERLGQRDAALDDRLRRLGVGR
jgi:hypothetical protein